MSIRYKAHETTQRKITPSESDLAIIEQFALAGEPINPEDLFIGRMSLANDQYDRSHERFPESYLAQFARTLPGKSVMTGHNYDLGPDGRIFKAEVQPGLTEGLAARKDLVVSYYLLASDPLAAKVKAGIARDVSIGFNPDSRLCDLCEKDYDAWMKGEEDGCSHVAGREYEGKLARVTYGGDIEKVEGLEGSFVWLGCQYGAQAIQSMRAFSPQAKAAYFESLSGKGVWALGDLTGPMIPPGYRLDDRPFSVALKEASMKDPKELAPPPEPQLTAEQERLIALGLAYVEFAKKHVTSRYEPCGKARQAERAVAYIDKGDVAEIEAEIKAADEEFNEKFPPSGKSVPMSDTPAQPVQRRAFNPFRQPVPRRG